MPGFRDFLTRFRPAGAPGQPTPGGVPVDRVAEASAELAAVFASLADVEAEALRIRDDGTARAEEIRGEAAGQAAAIIQAARARAEAERAETAARILAAGAAESDSLVTNAEHAARAIRRDAEKSMAEDAERLIGAVTAGLRSEAGGDQPRTPLARLAGHADSAREAPP